MISVPASIERGADNGRKLENTVGWTANDRSSTIADRTEKRSDVGR